MTSNPYVSQCHFCGDTTENNYPKAKCDLCLDKQLYHAEQEQSIEINNQRILELERIFLAL